MLRGFTIATFVLTIIVSLSASAELPRLPRSPEPFDAGASDGGSCNSTDCAEQCVLLDYKFGVCCGFHRESCSCCDGPDCPQCI